MGEAGFDEQEALLAYKAVLELVVGAVQRQEQRESDPDRDHAHRALFYEALTVSEPDELPNLAFIAAGWSRRNPEELFRLQPRLPAGRHRRRTGLAGPVTAPMRTQPAPGADRRAGAPDPRAAGRRGGPAARPAVATSLGSLRGGRP